MVLPNTIVVGAQKCGTTTLIDLMRQHPQVFVSEQKELHFFDTSRFTNGLAWYSEHFTPSSAQVVVAEGTPSYCYDPKARRRLNESLPDARLVMILRDPVDRAYSHYWHQLRIQKEDPITFEEALAREPERLQVGRVSQRRYGYVDRGKYLPQIRTLARLQGRHKLHVTFLEELRTDRAQALQALFAFLGVDPAPAATMAERWSNRYRISDGSGQERPAAYPPMAPDTRARLIEEFRGPNKRLARWLGRPLPPEWQV